MVLANERETRIFKEFGMGRFMVSSLLDLIAE